MEEVSCSRASLEAGESLAGTAVAETTLWIVLEHTGGWGPKGVEDSALPDAVSKHLLAFTAAEPRARVQLVKRPERRAPGITLFLARATPGHSSLVRTTLACVEDLLAIDLSSWAKGAEPPGFVRVDEPLYLVCIHGRRDRCCAQRGMPVFSALSAKVGEAAWQTTHLGGHRFAATLVVLPAGVCYGRVEPDEMGALVEAHGQARMHSLHRVRGRCAFPSETQAAELSLREQLGEHAIEALTWLGNEADEAGVLVRFRHDVRGEEHRVRVTHKPLPAFPQSCGAKPKPGDALVTLTLR